ncbi:Hypothetical protein CAP_1633 [Chondromyces apiculatus DSM 436]|uniref:Uncharacterized protein n=1 Tax=Chondromyces apiculatus DSM 436 TaxID=1192034 RepID=A0A017SUS0_9BACT|nr:Hypothetical protein CAP_1633 [Chondromyces apiculatus DSM 436]
MRLARQPDSQYGFLPTATPGRRLLHRIQIWDGRVVVQ